MLRIAIHNARGVTHSIMKGTLTGESVKELERCWRKAWATSSPPRILAELCDVRSVAKEGRKVPRLMAQAGVELIAVDLLMKAIVEEIAP